MLEIITPASYWILTILWFVILVLYLYKLRHSKAAGGAVSVLLTLLAIDAFRTLFESVYFGLYFNSMFGLLPGQIYELLSHPEMLIVPKLINIIAGVLVLVLLIRRWIPREIHEREQWIQDLEESQSELRESEEQFRLAVMGAPFPIMIHAEDGEVIRINDVWTELTGYSHAEIPTIEVWTSKAYAKEMSVVRAVIDTLYEVKEVANEGEFSVRVKSGDIRIWDFSSGPLGKDKNGRRLVISMAKDVTERKQAEDELREEKFRLNEIIHGTDVGTWEWNVKTGESIYNMRWAEIIGYTLGELAPTTIETWRQHTHPDDLKASQALLEKHFNGEHYEIECRMKHKDGRWIWVMIRGKVSTWTAEEKPLMMFGTSSDISAHKLAEQEHQRIDMLNSIGTLAGGIAHDFNNILSGLYGNVSLAKSKLKKTLPDHPGFLYLEAAEKSMNRATALTNQLLTFSKGGVPIKETLSLSHLIEEVIPFNLSGSNVKPVISQPDNLWLAFIDQGQIQQVFGNLTINAKQAMPSGGELLIALENVELSENQLLGLDGGKYIRITMNDNGTGITPAHLERIFDPYFTTKHAGSGLGLATVYSIIKRHGGHIAVASQLDKGTTLTLYLPAAEVQELPVTQDSSFSAPRQEAAHILVMDDEDMICAMVKDLLEDAGYSVEIATNSTQALEQYCQRLETGTPFDLVILDLTIPGDMGGKEVVTQILHLHPQAKVIVSSGYADDPVISNYANYGFKGVVTKPYELSTLMKTVNKVLMDGPA